VTKNEFDPDAYDDGHAFVYEAAADLVDLLDPTPDERVLDLGCGTGHLTARIAERGAEIVGIDADPAMVERARESYPEIEFRHADARTVDPPGRFDAVVSNAALHWIPEADQDAVLEGVASALVENGRFVAEFGGRGNVAAIRDALEAELAARGYDPDHPWYFPTVGEYATRVEAGGLEVRYASLFDRPTDLDGEAGLREWIGMFGDEFFTDVPDEERDAIVAAVEDRLQTELFADGVWTADYRRLRVRAERDDTVGRSG